MMHHPVRIARTANDAVPEDAPHLHSYTPRVVLIDWLSCVDRNGTWNDPDSIREGMPPMTLADAWEAIASMIGAL
jgi:hypothetical protein